MDQQNRSARRTCATALIALGIGSMAITVATMAALHHLEETAMETQRDPLASDAGETKGEMVMTDNWTGDVNWDYWTAINDDIVAWLHIPETGVDHPVVQAPADDPQFYLSHDVFGNWNLCGCPYIDADCEDGTESQNVIVYGHNMGDYSMFGELVNYLDRSWAGQHRRIELYTPDREMLLDVCGANTVNGVAERALTTFFDDEDLERYAQDKISACDMRLAELPSPTHRMFTICTCSYFTTPENERTLVYAFEADDELLESEGSMAS